MDDPKLFVTALAKNNELVGVKLSLQIADVRLSKELTVEEAQKLYKGLKGVLKAYQVEP